MVLQDNLYKVRVLLFPHKHHKSPQILRHAQKSPDAHHFPVRKILKHKIIIYSKLYTTLDSGKTKCEKNSCKCENGTPKSDSECSKHQAAMCKSCDSGFAMNSEQTSCTKGCQCDNGKLPLALLVQPMDVPSAIPATWATRLTLERPNVLDVRLVSLCQLDRANAKSVQSGTLLARSARRNACLVLVVSLTPRAAPPARLVGLGSSLQSVGAVMAAQPAARAKDRHPIGLRVWTATLSKSGRVASASAAVHPRSSSTTTPVWHRVQDAALGLARKITLHPSETRAAVAMQTNGARSAFQAE